MTDYGLLLNPVKEPSPGKVKFIDAMTWYLPALAIAASIASGIAALVHSDEWAAILSIAAGIVGGGGVVFTNWGSRIRDNRLAVAYGVGSLALDMADVIDRRNG